VTSQTPPYQLQQPCHSKRQASWRPSQVHVGPTERVTHTIPCAHQYNNDLSVPPTISASYSKRAIILLVEPTRSILDLTILHQPTYDTPTGFGARIRQSWRRWHVISHNCRGTADLRLLDRFGTRHCWSISSISAFFFLRLYHSSSSSIVFLRLFFTWPPFADCAVSTEIGCDALSFFCVQYVPTPDTFDELQAA
jgi:hypothetical protein